MVTVLADDRGRITLGSKMVERFGRKFAVVEMVDGIRLIPIPRDPLATLRELGKKAGIDRYGIKELRKMALEEAESEAMKGLNVRRH